MRYSLRTQTEGNQAVNDITPNDVYRETGRWFGPVLVGALAILVIGIILTFIGWQVGWLFTAHNVARTNQVYQGSYAVQQADIDTMQRAIGAISSAAGKAQANADAQEACSYAAKITVMPPGDKGWVAANCLAGAVAPDSQYAK